MFEVVQISVFFRLQMKSFVWHLSGRDPHGRDFAMGVYPMLVDESCFFLAVDFDGSDWQKDVDAFLQTCLRLEIPAALERSRSGEGGHVWFFFAEAVAASLARKLASNILTETMEARPEIGLNSYDRLFPNQDTLPKGGFGDLIALPLQKQARQRNNTIFLDEHFVPYPDQWAFLASMRGIGRSQAEARVREAESKGRILGVRIAATDEEDESPWTMPSSHRRKEPPIVRPLPKKIELVFADQIYLSKDDLVPGLAEPASPFGGISKS